MAAFCEMVDAVWDGRYKDAVESARRLMALAYKLVEQSELLCYSVI